MLSRRIFLAALATAASARAEEVPPLPPSLDQLTALALTRPDGASTTLGAEVSPGPAIISFWATWCAPCTPEARHFARVRADISPERLNIVGVNLDRVRDEAAIARFLSRAQVNFTQLRGDLAAYQAFGGGAQILLPRAFVFAADGTPSAAFGRYHGGATLRALDRAVEAVLG